MLSARPGRRHRPTSLEQSFSKKQTKPNGIFPPGIRTRVILTENKMRLTKPSMQITQAKDCVLTSENFKYINRHCSLVWVFVFPEVQSCGARRRRRRRPGVSCKHGWARTLASLCRCRTCQATMLAPTPWPVSAALTPFSRSVFSSVKSEFLCLSLWASTHGAIFSSWGDTWGNHLSHVPIDVFFGYFGLELGPK